MKKTGVLTQWNKERFFGKIDGTVFCHGSKFQHRIADEEICEGMEVEYEEGMNDKGPMVVNVLSVRQPHSGGGRRNEVGNQTVPVPQREDWKISTLRDAAGLPLKQLFSINDGLSGGVAEVVDFISDKDNYGNSKLSFTQLRRFYAELRGYRDIEEQLLLLKLSLFLTKVAYAVGRRNRTNVTKTLFDFFENRIACVHSSEDYAVFLDHLEAVVGYYRYRFGDK